MSRGKAQTLSRYNWICHAYCLMDNHYPLMIETQEANLSQSSVMYGFNVELTRFTALGYLASMWQIHFKNNRRGLSLFTAALVVYILLFSGFALFHVYSENELVDTHECAIGLSVSHGQALLPILVALVFFLIPLTVCPIPRLFFPVELFFLQKAIRAPPQQFSFC